MANFLPPVTFSIFSTFKTMRHQELKSQTMRRPLMNLVNTTLPQKYLKSSLYIFLIHALLESKFGNVLE